MDKNQKIRDESNSSIVIKSILDQDEIQIIRY